MKETANQGMRPDPGCKDYAKLTQLLDAGIATVQAGETELQPLPRRKLSRNARRLLKRIIKVTSEDDPVWAEGTEEVSKALKLNRSTVVRLLNRLCRFGVLKPLDITGGRGKVSQYAVDRRKAQLLLRRGYWETVGEDMGEKAAHKEEQHQAQLQKQEQGIPGNSSGMTALEADAQGLPISGKQMPGTCLYWGPLNWLVDESSEAVKTLKKVIQDPVTWSLLGHTALFAGTCVLGSLGIYKVWQTKGKGPALALSIPVGFAAYLSWRLLAQEFASVQIQSIIANHLESSPQATLQS